MQASADVLETLNGLLTIELTAINQYFLHSKLCENWGFRGLAMKLREVAMAEMRDAEEVTERILFLEGVPNLQRLGSITIGQNVPEQLQLQLKTEMSLVAALGAGIELCVGQRDNGTREFLGEMLSGEEAHIDWLETQLALIREVGEQNYLSQQIRG